jgi:hypothetical protein
MDTVEPKERYHAQQSYLMRIPSPFWRDLKRARSSFQGLPEAMRFGRFHTWGHFHDDDGDRRLPMLKYIRGGRSVSNNAQVRGFAHGDDRIDGWHHIQYLGEYMVCGYPLTRIMTSDEI